MNWSWVLPVVLQLLGVGIIMAEVIIPSMGILSLTALAVIGYSLYLLATGVSGMAAVAFAVGDVVVLPVVVLIGLKFLSKSSAALKTTLSSGDGVSSQQETLRDLVGLTGTAATDLRPSGKAMIGGRRMDVVTHGDYISSGTDLVVVSVEGNQVFVQGTQS